MPKALIEASRVAYRYRSHTPLVLHKLDMLVEEGNITAILGPNGAGKSTLLDLCLGWKNPESGTILLRNKELSRYSRRLMGRMMSLVPQNERVRFDYTVLEYLLLGRAPYLGQLEMPQSEDVEIALRALELVGLTDLQHRSASKLSGGEHQLMMIARALVQEPEVLLLDEPTSQLDPGNRHRVVSLLKKLNREGITVLFTTHDPNLAAEIASHALLLKDGRVVETGSAETVLTGPHLSELYGVRMEVIKLDGKKIVYSGIEPEEDEATSLSEQ